MKWIKENAKFSLAALIILSTSFITSSALAIETISPGNISSIVYAADGINFKLKQVDGSVVTDSGICGGNDTFHLSAIHTNYKAALGAVVSAHAASEFITLTLDGCSGSNALITSLQIGVDPSPPIAVGIMSLNIITGTGAYQEVLTNIDSVANEVMVVTKGVNSSEFGVFDTLRGTTAQISLSSSAAQASPAGSLTNFRVDGHAVSGNALTNAAATDYLHWTMQSKPGSFDIVTYNGTGATNQIAHALAGEVGMIWVKNLSTASDWVVWHKSLNQVSNEYLTLNSRLAKQSSSSVYSQAPTTTDFTVGSSSLVNASGSSYVAYIFAHNTSNQMFAGSYAGTNSSGNKQTIGFKPKVLILKDANFAGGYIFLSSAQQASDAWQATFNMGDAAPSQTTNTTAINVLDDGFSFTGGSGNWSGGDIIFFAIGDPQ